MTEFLTVTKYTLPQQIEHGESVSWGQVMKGESKVDELSKGFALRVKQQFLFLS